MGLKKPAPVVGADENEWRTIIENAVLDDELWKVKVIMIEAAGADQDRVYLNKFEAYAAEERRFVIKNICKIETMFMVNQLGGEKKAKDDNYRVFEEGQAYLKEKKSIPSDILALIIKHLILKMKQEYLFIQKQRLETKEGLKRESLIMVNKSEVRGSVSKKIESQEAMPSISSKSKSVKDPDSAKEVQPVGGKKYNTSLRLRGEEWRDKVYVDDFPIDGPNLYVTLTGFLDEELAVCLLKIGIPLTAIVQLKICSNLIRVPSSLNRFTKRQSQSELFSDTTLRFWEKLQDLRVKRATSDVFKNTAFIIFSPPYLQNGELTGNPEVIYDELCYLMYDIQDLSRQHQHYINNMTVIEIPAAQDSPKQNFYYRKQIEKIPLECVTMYTILDSILQTVCNNQEMSESTISTVTSSPSSPQADDSIEVKNAKTIVNDVFNILCKSDDCKQYRVTYGEEYEDNKDPIIIRNGDTAKLKTFHLKNVNLDSIIWPTLFFMPINNLWRNTPLPAEEIEAKQNFHFNVLMNSFDRSDVETSEMVRLLNLLACRKLFNNRSCLKKNHLPNRSLTEFKKTYLNRSEIAEPIRKCPSITRIRSSALHVTPIPNSCKDNEAFIDTSVDKSPEVEKLKLLFDCPDISELVSAAEIASQKPVEHMINDYEYFEDFTGTCAFQVLLKAFNDFNCVDCKHCEVTDCFVLMFFNSHDKDGVSREEWRNHIDTPVTLQDFFDFVIDEHYKWIKDEERNYDETMKLDIQSALKDSLMLINKTCIENTEIEDLVIEGSLKFQGFEIRDKEHAISLVSDGNTSPSSKKTATSVSTGNNSKPGEKAKSTPRQLSAHKNEKQDNKGKGLLEESVAVVGAKPFLGYSLGDRRIEVFGKECTFFSKDGSKVRTQYKLFIPSNQEYMSLCFVPGNNKSEFRLHKTFEELELSPKIIDVCDSFRVSCEDEMIINIKKQMYSVEQNLDAHLQQEFYSSDNASRASTTKMKQPIIETPLMETSQTYSYYSFVVGWPNGLMCESVYNDKSSVLSHIKQYYTNPLPDLQEDMRCVTWNGEVIIFYTDGNIQVLHPEGTRTLITKYEKKVIINTQTPEAQSEVPDKNDKKKKEKGKHQKPHLKSKLPIIEDETIIKEYELIIEEFEMIETSGSKKKWTQNVAVETEKLLIKTATDFCQGEIFSKRSDGTNILLNKDGVQVVTFPTGIRIITSYVIEEEEIFAEWTIEELHYFELLDLIQEEESAIKLSQKSNNTVDSISSPKTENSSSKYLPISEGFVSIQLVYTVEHQNFATVIINKSNETIRIDSPNKTSLIIDSKNNYEMILDNATTAKFNGSVLDINYVSCLDCRVSSECKIKIYEEMELKKKWLKLLDSFGKKISVTYEGTLILDDETDEEVPEVEGIENELNIERIEEESKNVDDTNAVANDKESLDKIEDFKSESSLGAHYKCTDLARVNPRFFVLRRDLSCSELVNRTLVDEYKTYCQWQPWCSYNEHDTFNDHRKLYSILSPINLTETDKWLVDSSLADKPLYLSYKDLKKDSGKGFYQWMRPYERFVPQSTKPLNVLPPRQPKAFVLRTLEKQWSDDERDELKGGTELIKAILKYRKSLEADCEMLMTVPLRDIRCAEDQQSDVLVQGLAERIYEDLKARLEEDILSRTRATITTQPLPPASPTSNGDAMEEEQAPSEALEEEQTEFLKEVDEAEKLSPNLARYWQQRIEADKEEEFYKYLLRAGSVPPYFQNILGGAIWWEVNKLTTDATAMAEAKKSACVCSPPGEGDESVASETPYM